MVTNTNAKRDANHVPVMLGRGDNGETLPIAIDHVTGRILAIAYPVSNASPSSPKHRALRDDNHTPVVLGETDDGNHTPTALAIDSGNGYIAVDIVVE